VGGGGSRCEPCPLGSRVCCGLAGFPPPSGGVVVPPGRVGAVAKSMVADVYHDSGTFGEIGNSRLKSSSVWLNIMCKHSSFINLVSY
jgi:hypothetical protein